MTANKKQSGPADEPAVIIFDGECVLCSANAQFILKHDANQRFFLASMQGEYGQQLYRKNGIDPSNPETLIVAQGDKILRNSDAILSIYMGLGWPWKIAGALRFIPRFLRDPVYLFIARNRYRIFGKRDICWLPDPQYKDRVL